MRIIQRARMNMRFCKVCGFDTPHIPVRGCLVCMKVKEAQQEQNRLDAMELYDGAAVKTDES